MKRILVHAKAGMVSVVRINEDNKIVVKEGETFFVQGAPESTIPNTMNAVAGILEELALEEGIFELATIGAVADKINSDMLVKEFREKKVLSAKRELTADELAVYERLITAIGNTYGKVLIKSEQYIAKTSKPGQNAEQSQWVAMFETSQKHIDQMFKKLSAPVVYEVVGLDEEEKDVLADALRA